jgi:HSP20 family protein
MVPQNKTEDAGKGELEQLLVRNVSHLHGRTATWHVPYDIKEAAREFVVLVDLPGVDEDEIRIDVRGEFLEIEAMREFDHDREDAEEYTHIERSYGRLACRIALPSSLETEEITAKYKRGVLTVRMPWRHDRKKN